MARSKQPKSEFSPTSHLKTPKGGEKADSLDQEKFRWRSKAVDAEGIWGFSSLTCDDIWQTIIPKLHDFETMKWSELINDRSSSNHIMPVKVLETGAKKRLEDIKKGQLEYLFQLNLGGKIRLWGQKDGNTFNLLWYDPDHTVYIVHKKKT